MKIIPIPLSFGVNEEVYETDMGFKTADVNSAVLQFTSDVDPVGCVATLTMNNETDNANRVSTVLEQFDVGKNPFDYFLQEEIQSEGVWLGDITLKRNLITVCSQKFRFSIGSSLQAKAIEQLVKSKSLDELVLGIREDVMEHLGKNDLSVKEIEKYVNEVVAKLLLGETNRNLNENERKLNELARNNAFEVWTQAVQDLIDQGIIDQRVQAVIEEFQSTYSTSLFSLGQQLAQAAMNITKKVGDGVLAEMGDLSQDVKTAMTGGSVAVVGVGAVAKVNLASDIKAEIDTPIANMIMNGDFSSGTTGWASSHYTLTTEANVLKAAVLTNSYSASFYKSSVVTTVGKKYYLKLDIKPKFLKQTFFQPNGGSWTNLPKPTVENEWNTLSTVFTPSASGGGNFVFFHDTSLGYVAGDVIEFRKFALINLTDTFGVGNEPTDQEMTRLLARFPESWFTGTQNIFTAKWALSELRRLDAELGKRASYVVAKNFAGANGGEKIQAALNVLYPLAYPHKIVVVDAEGPDADGAWLVKSQLKIPSNTTLLLNGAYLKLDAQVNYAILTNSDFVNGNTNIHIEGHGAVLDCNRANQNLDLNSYRNIGVHLYNVYDFSVKGVKVKDASRWGLVPEKCVKGTIDDIYFDFEGHVNQDGVHIIGPSSDIMVSRIRGTLGDDACVVNARLKGSGTSIFQGYGDGGDISHVTFSDVIISGGTAGTGAHTGILRTSGSPASVIDGIELNNAIGYNLRDGVLRLGGNDEIPLENHRNISANNVIGYEGVSGPVSLVNMLRPVKNLQINNAKVFSSSRPIIKNNNQAIDGLQLSNIQSTLTGDVAEESLLSLTAASIKNVQLANVQIKRTNSAVVDGGLFGFLWSTIENLTVNNVQALSAERFIKELTTPTQATLKNMRLRDVTISNSIVDKFGTMRDIKHELIVNGWAKEDGDGISVTPRRPNYQTGDIVEYAQTAGGSSKYYQKTPVGTWLELQSAT